MIMSCDCDNCTLGEGLQKIVDKYKLSADDSWYLLNDVFLIVEHLQLEKQQLQEENVKLKKEGEK